MGTFFCRIVCECVRVRVPVGECVCVNKFMHLCVNELMCPCVRANGCACECVWVCVCVWVWVMDERYYEWSFSAPLIIMIFLGNNLPLNQILLMYALVRGTLVSVLSREVLRPRS